MLKSERYRISGWRRRTSGEASYPYLRGLWLWRHYRYCKDGGLEAQTLFRRALSMHPKYTEATALLAITLCSAAYLGWVDDVERNYDEAFQTAERAVSLDTRYPVAHYALGLVCMWTHRSDRAMLAFQEAINLNPNYAAAHVLLGQTHVYCGKPREGFELAEKGIRLSPKDPRLFTWLPAVAGAHYQLRQYAEAVEIGRRSWILNPSFSSGLHYMVASLAQLGQIDEARTALDELRLIDPTLASVEGNLERLFYDRAPVDHILDGLRKAGFE